MQIIGDSLAYDLSTNNKWRLAMVGTEDSSPEANSRPSGWLDLRVGNRLLLFCVHQINRINPRNDPVVMTDINVVYY